MAACGGTGISSDVLAQTVGAVSCSPEHYELVDRLDGSKARLYSCDMGYGRMICVTYEGGIARNVTAESRLLWADTLGSAKPSCLS